MTHGRPDADSGIISPLPPLVTAEVSLHRILGYRRAVIGKTEGGGAVWRVYHEADTMAGSTAEIAAGVARLLVFNMVVMLASGFRVEATSLPGGGSVEGQPSIALRFLPAELGTLQKAESQDPSGKVTPIESARVSELSSALRAEIVDETIKFLTFRSLYGTG